MYSKDELNELINRAVGNVTCSEEAERLYAPVRYILSLGGKRLRPLVTLMSCNIFSDRAEEALMPAVGLEIFHNFTLVHDDIMDNAPVRRKSPTVHEKWNSNQAILSGDVMAFIANEYMAATPPASFQKVFKLYNRTAIEVCIGQQMDMDFEMRQYVSRDEYLRMIELKTAVLLAACMKCGAIIGGASDRDSDLMYQFGRNLGLAFQIQDDILDVYGDPALFGKKIGGDIVENKKTFLLIKALELARGDEGQKLTAILNRKEFVREEKISEVIKIYDTLGIKSISENLAGEYISKAFGFLVMSRLQTKEKRLFFILRQRWPGENIKG
jgi:geranylgeranyl diphosphate synthase, type II